MIQIFGIQFYPTPPELVQHMLSKVDFENVTYILEPSAGKGDIIDGFVKYLNQRRKTYTTTFRDKDNKANYKSFDVEIDCVNYTNKICNMKFQTVTEINKYFYQKCGEEGKDYLDYKIYTSESKISQNVFEIEAIEIDTNLQAILRNKSIVVVGDDFIKFDGCARYDLIMMNPPFKDGDKHLLKALEMLENGGQCVCILNAETLKNPYTDNRQYLCNLLDKYNADIEYMSNTFSNAENSTDVDIAMVYVNIPRKEIELDTLKNLVLGENYDKKYEEYNDTQLATNDYISNIVKQYEFEAKAGLKIIDTFYSMIKYIPIINDDKNIKMINLSIVGCSDEALGKIKFTPANTYIRQLRDKYWSILFRSNEMSKLLTETTKNKYLSKIREFRNYDFTFSNIKQLQFDLVTHLNSNIDEAILKQFDNFTYNYSLGNSTNVHYFNGWKTNNAFMIRNKVIIPIYNIYSNYGWSIYHATDFLAELEKIFVYLDGGTTDGDNVNRIMYEISQRHQYDGERINFKYFDVEFKKKGTVHIWFNNENLLKKFNIFGCQKHGWLPDSYGKKKYQDMSKEEQEVVDNFEGEKNYNATITNSNYFLSGNQMLRLETI